MTNTITLPDNWSQVTISKFIEISRLDNAHANYPARLISVLSDMDLEDVKAYDTASFVRMMDYLSWVSQLPDEGQFKKIVEIDGIEYGFVSKLSELSLGNWVDLEEYLKDYPKNLHKVMSILYRPLVTALNDDYRIIEEYDSSTGRARADLFLEKMNVQDVHGASLFFCLIGSLSTISIKDFFLRKINQSQTKKKTNKKSLTSGIGMRMFTPWQRGILQRLGM